MKKKLLITEDIFMHPVTKTIQPYQACALYEDSRMVEISVLPAGAESILNNIYVARVQNVVPSLNAAFVEITKGQLCYLPFEDLKEPLFTKKLSKKRIAAGDELAVQVTKEAIKTKDAVVTTNLSFPGEYLVLTSANHTIGVSSKLPAVKRKSLKELAEGLRGEGTYGIIVRTNAAGASKEQIRDEFRKLKAEYDTLLATAASRTLYSCLRREQPFYQKILMDTDKSVLEEVVTDDPEVFAQLTQYFPQASYRIRLYEDRLLPLARLYNMSKQVEAALKERVWLKSGANIILQPTEALTVIDVNSGKKTAKKEKQQYHYQINLEAAEEIAKQLRLRNISGIIIVDFIDLYDEALNTSLLSAFRTFLQQDPIPVQLIGMTKLGLVELTRKKHKKSLREQLIFSKNA